MIHDIPKPDISPAFTIRHVLKTTTNNNNKTPKNPFNLKGSFIL